jgi:hypothetical protein
LQGEVDYEVLYFETSKGNVPFSRVSAVTPHEAQNQNKEDWKIIPFHFAVEIVDVDCQL